MNHGDALLMSVFILIASLVMLFVSKQLTAFLTIDVILILLLEFKNITKERKERRRKTNDSRTI